MTAGEKYSLVNLIDESDPMKLSETIQSSLKLLREHKHALNVDMVAVSGSTLAVLIAYADLAAPFLSLLI